MICLVSSPQTDCGISGDECGLSRYDAKVDCIRLENAESVLLSAGKADRYVENDSKGHTIGKVVRIWSKRFAQKGQI